MSDIGQRRRHPCKALPAVAISPAGMVGEARELPLIHLSVLQTSLDHQLTDCLFRSVIGPPDRQQAKMQDSLPSRIDLLGPLAFADNPIAGTHKSRSDLLQPRPVSCMEVMRAECEQHCPSAVHPI